MEQKIKEIRVQLDGLTQLTRNLSPVQKFVIDIASIPDGFTVDRWLEVFEQTPYHFIDSNKSDTNPITVIDGKEYINKAVDSLNLSKMWLGKVLKELGTVNPYPKSKDPNSNKIEPTADQGILYGMITEVQWKEFNHIQKVKWLRAEIEKVEREIKKLELDLKIKFTVESVNYKDSWINQHTINSRDYCIEAGMHLGMELGRIKQLEDKQLTNK